MINYLSFFPYDQFRKEQEKIIKQIEIDSKSRKNTLLVAPNGSGKTIIALSGLLPLAYKKNLKIIYMCRTHSQNRRVVKELIKISQKVEEDNLGITLNGLSIRGRNEMCLNETLLSLKVSPKESMSVCKDLRQNGNCAHFSKLLKKKGKVENLTSIAPEIFNKPVDAEELIDFCKSEKICPYFLCKFLLKDMKVIICNYQWILNPYILEIFLQFVDQELNNCILVLDECHNIIDVATDVNSDRLTPYALRLCLKDLEMYRSPRTMQRFVRTLLDHLDEKKNGLKLGDQALDPIKYLKFFFKELEIRDLNEFKNLIEEMKEFSISVHEVKNADGRISRDFLGSFAEFWLKWLKTYNLENYFFCFTVKLIKGKRSISLEIVALDPREIVIPILKSVYTSLNLSGTVKPLVYKNLMGLNESGKSYNEIIADSPFQKKNVKAVIVEGVDTRRDNRTPEMFEKIINKINEVLVCTPANVGIFCASYQILKGLLSNGIETIVERNNKSFFKEAPGLTASENNKMVDQFKMMASNGGAVLLGVCGGRNSEGEDYPGNYMNSVVIAGIPYHLPTPRVNAKIKYYDKVFRRQGWNFAYLYPAIQRANQASGRPIRKITDKGAIIFLDSRFKAKNRWISEWIRDELEIIPDKPNALFEALNPFWNVK
jgi:DNA excision repair protein ERCC-2